MVGRHTPPSRSYLADPVPLPGTVDRSASSPLLFGRKKIRKIEIFFVGRGFSQGVFWQGKIVITRIKDCFIFICFSFRICACVVGRHEHPASPFRTTTDAIF